MSTTVHLNHSDVAIIVRGYRVGNPDEFFCIDFTEQGVATEFYLTRDQLSMIAYRALGALSGDDAIEVPEIVAPVEAEAVVDAPLICDHCGGTVVVEDGDYKHLVDGRSGKETYFTCRYVDPSQNADKYASIGGSEQVPESEVEAVVDAPTVCDNCGGAVVVEDGDYKHLVVIDRGELTYYGCQYHTLDPNDERYATVNGNYKVPESEVAS